MITFDENEKRAMQPPEYTSVNGTMYPPPPQPTSPSHGPAYPAPSMPPPGASPAHSPGVYPGTPGSAAPLMSPPPPQQQMTPAQLEAQMGSQYQQQLFARCARGDHDVVTKYGPCGIISSILLFPIGLLFLLVDVDKKCARCGVTIP